SITSTGYTIESPGDTCGFDQPTDQVNVSADDLKLGPLQDNGGPTMTHALGAGSVSIDAIPGPDCEADADQRGEPRPGGTMCDVGSFEVQP
ncbi:MAG: calcium-binding protein, partial [Deltaproteobacteria bacterium]|nr:calcium-binding protein [Deltaproteobacteria bacterium]